MTISEGEHKGRVLELRQVTRRKPGDTRQMHILTTRPAAALPAAGVIYRMTSRWREENYFRYGRAHFALDALDTYAVTPEDPDRLVPNPAKKTAAATVKTAKKTLAAAEAAREGELAALRSPAPGTAAVITNEMLARLDAPSTPPAATSQAAQAAARAVPRRSRSAEHNPHMVKLDTETKLITHAIRMAACNAETILARALNGRYARAGDEAYALIREALHRQRRHHLQRRRPAHPPGPAIRTPPHPRPGRPLRTAHRHRNPLPRNPARPALRSQRTPRHYMNSLRYVRSPGAVRCTPRTQAMA